MVGREKKWIKRKWNGEKRSKPRTRDMVPK